MSPQAIQAPAATGYNHCLFGLIVTGKGERDFLPHLFSTLMQAAGCSFEVIGFIGQRSAITSPAKKLTMAGTGKTIPNRDEERIGLPARRHLRNQPHHFVLLIDDVEAARRPMIDQIFTRYRKAMDTMLIAEEKNRAAVHFFANMLEAYYFAHSDAVNQALGNAILAGDWQGDVEQIEHPKGKLKELRQGFDERAHGADIVPLLDLHHILSNADTCAFLRSQFAWCVKQLNAHAQIWDANLSQYFRLPDGSRAPLTNNQ